MLVHTRVGKLQKDYPENWRDRKMRIKNDINFSGVEGAWGDHERSTDVEVMGAGWQERTSVWERAVHLTGSPTAFQDLKVRILFEPQGSKGGKGALVTEKYTPKHSTDLNGRVFLQPYWRWISFSYPCKMSHQLTSNIYVCAITWGLKSHYVIIKNN